MHDGELAGEDNLDGLCLQAIPSNSKGGDSSVRNTVVREQDHMEKEATVYSALF